MANNPAKDPELLQLTRGFEKLAKDPDLRFLLANILVITGDSTTPFDQNALRMAYLNGRHSVGTDIRANMERLAPKLYIRLLQDGLAIQTRNEEKDNSYEDSVE